MIKVKRVSFVVANVKPNALPKSGKKGPKKGPNQWMNPLGKIICLTCLPTSDDGFKSS